MFSRFAVYLRINDALCRSALGDALKKAFYYNNTELEVVHLDTLANMSDFLVSKGGLHLDGCMSHRHFRLLRDNSGVVICQVRSSPIVSYHDEPWQGLAADTNTHHLFPNGVPDLLAAMVHQYIIRGHLCSYRAI